jgi:hypothetical protein
MLESKVHEEKVFGEAKKRKFAFKYSAHSQ